MTKTWDEADLLSRSPELNDVLRVRLVQIAFSDNPSASIRAIEMLFNMPATSLRRDFAGVSTDDLRAARAKAQKWLDSTLLESGDA